MCRGLQWAFFEAGFEVITGRALRENMASRKLLEKLGFEKTGTEPFDGLVNGKKSEWQNYGIYRKQD